jgi:hypothetical protein
MNRELIARELVVMARELVSGGTVIIVESPHGSNMVEAIKEWLKRNGYAAEDNPLMEGSDTASILVSRSRSDMRQALKVIADLQGTNEEDEFLDFIPKSVEMLTSDWKEMEIGPDDLRRLRRLGIKVKIEDADSDYKLTISR